VYPARFLKNMNSCFSSTLRLTCPTSTATAEHFLLQRRSSFLSCICICTELQVLHARSKPTHKGTSQHDKCLTGKMKRAFRAVNSFHTKRQGKSRWLRSADVAGRPQVQVPVRAKAGNTTPAVSSQGEATGSGYVGAAALPVSA
jgi:hypothetical protein